MHDGFVLDFTNCSFEEFFREVVGVPIYDSRFNLGSGSKANRMRVFWQVATDKQLLLYLDGLVVGWEIYTDKPIPQSAKTLLFRITSRLRGVPNTAPPATEQSMSISQDASSALITRLLKLTDLPPQKRGYEYEAFLKNLFDAYGLSPRASFRIKGEQIDGSFCMHNEIYLLEAKWQNAQTGAADLHTFEGKLGEKASWSRGLFVSNSGFTTEGLQAFGRGKRIVCMDGFDLAEMLRLKLSFVEVLEAKVRRAAETGSTFSSVRDIFA